MKTQAPDLVGYEFRQIAEFIPAPNKSLNKSARIRNRALRFLPLRVSFFLYRNSSVFPLLFLSCPFY